MNEQNPSPPLIAPQEGMRVRTIEYIDRYPFFLLKEVGLTGTVLSVEDHLIVVKMDELIPGCEAWDNEIQLTDDEFGDFGNGIVIASLFDLFHHYFAPIHTGETI